MGGGSDLFWSLGGLKKSGRGYVSSLSGLLTGLPPFMTTGSLVVLLEGGPAASLGTASPTSCNEGSLYIATARVGEEEEKGRKIKRRVFMYDTMPYEEMKKLKIGFIHFCESCQHTAIPSFDTIH